MKNKNAVAAGSGETLGIRWPAWVAPLIERLLKNKLFYLACYWPGTGVAPMVPCYTV